MCNDSQNRSDGRAVFQNLGTLFHAPRAHVSGVTWRAVALLYAAVDRAAVRAMRNRFEDARRHDDTAFAVAFGCSACAMIAVAAVLTAAMW